MGKLFGSLFSFVNPYEKIIEVCAIVALVYGVFYAGEKFERSTWLEKQVVSLQELGAAKDKAQGYADKYASAQEQINTLRSQRLSEALSRADQVLSRPVYRDCKLDDDGLRLYNSLSTEPPAGPGNPANVPVGPDPAIPRHGVDGEESPANGEQPQRVPAEAP